MDVAVHIVDLLRSLYTQIYCQVEPQVSRVLLQTANAPCFASSPLSAIALHCLSSTEEPSSGTHTGVTLISGLQDIIRVPRVAQILLQSCMEVLAAVAVLPENTRCIDATLISHLLDGPTNPLRKLLEAKAVEVLTHYIEHAEAQADTRRHRP